MTKLTGKAFRQELLLNVVSGLLAVGIMVFLISRLESGVFRVLLWAEVGFYLVVVSYSTYQLLTPKAFKRGLTARNDERYQLIQNKANLMTYLVGVGFLGAFLSFDALGHVLGTTTLDLAIWEFIVILISLGGLTYALAKLYYQHRL